MTNTRSVTKSHGCHHKSDTPSNDQVIKSARRQIDEEITKLNDSIRELRSRRNALAPISRLPAEMLSKIFIFHSSAGQTDYSSGNSLSWIKVSHVCRHWRAVALECPSLWSCIIFSRPTWTYEMLKRSKMAPLVIKADLTYFTPRMIETVQSALEHMSRIRELHIGATTNTMEKLLSSLCNNANHLQSLCLSDPRRNRFGIEEGYTLPVNIFNGETPRLKRLELIKCHLPWNTPLLSGLIHLKIHTSVCRPTTTELISIFEKMPQLETLDLEDSLPSIPATATSAPSVERVISLPRLSSIRISASVLECANVLNHLSFPAAAFIQLACSSTETTDVDFSSIFPTLSNVGGSGKPLRTLCVHHSASDSILIQAWTSVVAYTDCPLRNSISSRIELRLSWMRGRNGAEQVMTSVCKALPLAQLKTLHVCHYIGLSKNAWLNTFGVLPKLRNLHVERIYANGLIDALMAEPDDKQQADLDAVARRPVLRRKKSVAPGVSFPGLRCLVLEEIDFQEEEDTLLDAWRTCLMERCERKADLRELVLVNCIHLFDEQVDLLQEIVVDVEWDEVVQGYSDSEEDEVDMDDMYGYPNSLGTLATYWSEFYSDDGYY